MKNYTDITILLDRSGSMQSIQTAMEGAFAEFIQAHKKNPSTRLSLVQFDGENPYDVVYTAQPVKDVPALKIRPRGSTPLLDALCKTIDSAGRRFSELSERERPNKVLFVVITDGQENASTEFRRTDVRHRIEKQNGSYNWQFVYLGANQDAYREAESFGIPMAMAMNYTASASGVRGMSSGLASNTAAYASTGDADLLKWSKEQQTEATEDDGVSGKA